MRKTASVNDEAALRDLQMYRKCLSLWQYITKYDLPRITARSSPRHAYLEKSKQASVSGVLGERFWARLCDIDKWQNATGFRDSHFLTGNILTARTDRHNSV